MSQRLSREDFLTVVRLAPLVSLDLVVTNPRGEVLVGLRTNRPALSRRHPTSRPSRAPAPLDPSSAHRHRASQRPTNPAVTASSTDRTRTNPVTASANDTSSMPSGPDNASRASTNDSANPTIGPVARQP